MALIVSLMLMACVVMVCNCGECNLEGYQCYTNNSYGHETIETCNTHGKKSWCQRYNKFVYRENCRYYLYGGCDIQSLPGHVCPLNTPRGNCFNRTVDTVTYAYCCCWTGLCNDDAFVPYHFNTTTKTTTTTTTTIPTTTPYGLKHCAVHREGKRTKMETCLPYTENCFNEFRGNDIQTIINSGCDCHQNCKGLPSNKCTWNATEESYFCCCNDDDDCNFATFKPIRPPPTTHKSDI